MQYVAFRRFHRCGMGGMFNIPYGSLCDEVNGVILYQGTPVCLNTSQVAKEYFATNYDGKGLLRGSLTYGLAFGKKLTDKQKIIYRVDPFVNQFVRDDCQTILFNDSFFHASIEDLYKVRKKLEVNNV